MKAYLRFKAWCISQVEKLKTSASQQWITCCLWSFSLGIWLVVTCAGWLHSGWAAGLVGCILFFLWGVSALVALYATDRAERTSVIQKIMFWQAGMSVIALGLDLQANAMDPNSPAPEHDLILRTTSPWLFVAVSGLLLEPVKLLEKQSRQRQES